jgi:hypothetical protein
MKKLLCVVLFTLSCIYANAQTRETLQSRYIEYLKSIGITGSIVENGVDFQILGGKFHIRFLEAFPNALFLIYPGIIDIGTEEKRTKAALAALAVTKDLYDVEFFLHPDSAFLGIRICEYFISPDDFKVNFQLYLGLLIQAHTAFMIHYNSL